MHGETPHRRDIQGLRAVAVLMVIAAHAGVDGVAGGFVGVDVFFVVSGFLITTLLLRDVAETGRVRIAAFYARRARRILPAATVVLVAVMAYAARETAPARVAQIGDDARWSAFFAANLHFARLGEDYFAQGRETSPFQHYWSLAVEEQFYLVWPLLLAAAVLAGRRGTRHLTAVLVFVTTASMAWSVLLTADAPTVAYYSSPARAWELGVGALLAVHRERLSALGRRTRGWLGALGFAAVLAAGLVYGPASAFPGWRALLPVLGTGAMLAAGMGGAGPVGVCRLLGTRVLTWVGDRSYSLYLWHWPVLVLGREHTVALGNVAGVAVLLGMTLGAALASYHLVENPLRRARALRRGSHGLVLWPVALAGILLVVVAAERHAVALLEARLRPAGTSAATTLTPTPTADPRPSEPTRRKERRSLPEPTSVEDLLRRALGASDRGGPVPLPLTNLPGLDADSWHLHYTCNAPGPAARSRVCPVGDPRGRRTLVVYGDSRAGQWLPALDRLGRAEGYRVVPFIKYGCPPYDVPMVDGAGADFVSCPLFRSWALAAIEKADPDVVLLGAEAVSWRMRSAPGLDREATWATGVARVVERVGAGGADVVVLADITVQPVDPEVCLTDPDATLAACDYVPSAWSREGNALTARAATAEGAASLDVTPLLCLDGRCPIVVDGAVTYSDANHVSATWSRMTAGPFARLLRQALAGLR